METLYTILKWFAEHPSGRTLEELIDSYWEIIKIDDDFTIDQLVELFMIAAEISTLDLEEGLFYLVDVEDVYNNSIVPRDQVLNSINDKMKDKRSNDVSK